MAQVHWCRTAVIGTAVEVDVEARRRCNARDEADGQALMLEDLALLDVELKEGAQGPRVPGRLDMVGVKMTALEHLVECMAFLVVQSQQVIVRELAAHGPTAERRRREAARLLTEE